MGGRPRRDPARLEHDDALITEPVKALERERHASRLPCTRGCLEDQASRLSEHFDELGQYLVYGQRRQLVDAETVVANAWPGGSFELVTEAAPTMIRTTEIETKRATAKVFVSWASPQTILASIAVVAGVRVWFWDWGWADVVVVGATVAMTGLVEWVIHEHLLHASEDSFTTRRLGTGLGHRQHHLDPPELEWVLLGGLDAAAFVVLLAGFTALWSVPLLWLTNSAILLPYLSGLLAAYVSLANYEWTHLLVHTGYSPKTRFYSGLRRNHRLHHYRNEHYWLGVTSNVGDRVLRTYPRDKSLVPLSDTARTLDETSD